MWKHYRQTLIKSAWVSETGMILVLSSQHKSKIKYHLWHFYHIQHSLLENKLPCIIKEQWQQHVLIAVNVIYFAPFVSSGNQFRHMCTVYPKKYAHGFCFAVLCRGYTLTDFPISIRLTSLALWQSNDCPSASKATLMNMDKYFMWIHYERLHNHNKAIYKAKDILYIYMHRW